MKYLHLIMIDSLKGRGVAYNPPPTFAPHQRWLSLLPNVPRLGSAALGIVGFIATLVRPKTCYLRVRPVGGWWLGLLYIGLVEEGSSKDPKDDGYMICSVLLLVVSPWSMYMYF